jgi:hypothetical protein
MDYFLSLLSPGGIMIGPFGSQLLCIEMALSAATDAGGLCNITQNVVAAVAFVELQSFSTPYLDDVASHSFNSGIHTLPTTHWFLLLLLVLCDLCCVNRKRQ